MKPPYVLASYGALALLVPSSISFEWSFAAKYRHFGLKREDCRFFLRCQAPLRSKSVGLATQAQADEKESGFGSKSLEGWFQADAPRAVRDAQ